MSIFNKVKIKKPRRSTFDLSHEVKTTCEFGTLVPIMCEEVVPGDTFSLNSQVFCRVAPMLAPIMSRVNLYTHFFFVPNRIIWDRWEDFITGGEDGNSYPGKPMCTLGEVIEKSAGYGPGPSKDDYKGSLADYFGLPFVEPGDSGIDEYVDLLPFFAYQKIWNDWYRDQNLQQEVDIPTHIEDEFAPSIALMSTKQRCWKRDYLTSALPWPQRGPDVHLPMEGSIPPLTTDGLLYGADGRRYTNLQVDPSNIQAKTSPALGVTTSVENDVVKFKTSKQNVNLSSIAPTIIETRRAFKVQEWLERNAVGGSRYIEQILSHFGVKSSDSRLQRPELLGGGKSPILISEVLQTSESTTTSPQGTMTGHGVSAQSTHRFKRYFEEHGYVIGIMSIMPSTSYLQGIDKKWTRFDKFDYLWPEFASIGEQPILEKEVAVGFVSSKPNSVFGYTPRYSEYKYRNSSYSGEFRDTMLNWHLGRYFKSHPVLNSDFVSCNNSYRPGGQQTDDLNRIFAYQHGHHFWVQVYHNLIAKRPLPYYGETHF